jgi:gas vesicle protein
MRNGQYDNSHDEHSGSLGIIGFLSGVAVGAALGVLFAPKSGRELRGDIAEAGGNAKEKLNDLIDNGHREWSRLKGKAVDMASMTRDEVKDFIQFLFNEGQDLRSRVKNEVRDGMNTASRRTSEMADDMRRGV